MLIPCNDNVYLTVKMHAMAWGAPKEVFQTVMQQYRFVDTSYDTAVMIKCLILAVTHVATPWCCGT
jgi:hypothetical protein